MTVEDVAKVAHDANRAYCSALGDLSQAAWPEAPAWQRQSAVTGVAFIRDNPGASPSASDESWLAEKYRDGWAYGPEKDPARKLHPCYMPYDELPPEQRAKDALFGGVVRALLPLVGTAG